MIQKKRIIVQVINEENIFITDDVRHLFKGKTITLKSIEHWAVLDNVAFFNSGSVS